MNRCDKCIGRLICGVTRNDHNCKKFRKLLNAKKNLFCKHAKIRWAVCECAIENEVNSKMSECNGEGRYIVIGNLCSRHHYQCNRMVK